MGAHKDLTKEKFEFYMMDAIKYKPFLAGGGGPVYKKSKRNEESTASIIFFWFNYYLKMFILFKILDLRDLSQMRSALREGVEIMMSLYFPILFDKNFTHFDDMGGGGVQNL